MRCCLEPGDSSWPRVVSPCAMESRAFATPSSSLAVRWFLSRSLREIRPGVRLVGSGIAPIPSHGIGQEVPMSVTTGNRSLPAGLRRLEAESIGILREVAAEFRNPVMLYSIGKDSGVMLHLAMKAFHPSKPPFPLLHVDTGWKFREMIRHRDQVAARYGVKLLVHVNAEGIVRGINPISSGSALHTQVMKTEALKQALDLWGFDAAFGGARRDEEKSRAKERIFSFRSAAHAWDPRSQRPELWQLYNTRIAKGETIRVFPLSNWTELDIWQYTRTENIPVVPLYFAAP